MHEKIESIQFPENIRYLIDYYFAKQKLWTFGNFSQRAEEELAYNGIKHLDNFFEWYDIYRYYIDISNHITTLDIWDEKNQKYLLDYWEMIHIFMNTRIVSTIDSYKNTPDIIIDIQRKNLQKVWENTLVRINYKTLSLFLFISFLICIWISWNIAYSWSENIIVVVVFAFLFFWAIITIFFRIGTIFMEIYKRNKKNNTCKSKYSSKYKEKCFYQFQHLSNILYPLSNYIEFSIIIMRHDSNLKWVNPIVVSTITQSFIHISHLIEQYMILYNRILWMLSVWNLFTNPHNPFYLLKDHLKQESKKHLNMIDEFNNELKDWLKNHSIELEEYGDMIDMTFSKSKELNDNHASIMALSKGHFFLHIDTIKKNIQ
jgi:hypothetical protein